MRPKELDVSLMQKEPVQIKEEIGPSKEEILEDLKQEEQREVMEEDAQQTSRPLLDVV